VAGLGIGFVVAPLTTIAMGNVPDWLGGPASSGGLNTVRQAGTAAGAPLQNRLVASLTSQATSHAGVLWAAPSPFVVGFGRAASSGTPGSGPSTSLKSAGIPPSLAHEVARLAAIVLGKYVKAIRRTMTLSIAVVALAAVTAFAIRQGPIASDECAEGSR
jgi:hypothetical protein